MSNEKISIDKVKEILEKYISYEERDLDFLLKGKFTNVKADDKMLIKRHLKSRIELLRNLEYDIIGE